MMYTLFANIYFRIALIGLIVIAVTAGVYMSLQAEPDLTIKKVTSTSKTNSLTIQYGTIERVISKNSDDKESVDFAINNRLKNKHPTKKNYQVVYRESTLNQSTIDNTPVIQALFDIPELKETYLLYNAGNSSSDQHIIYFVCADRSQQKESSWKCVDEKE